MPSQNPLAEKIPDSLQEIAEYCLQVALLAKQHQAAKQRIEQQKQVQESLQADFFGKQKISS